MIDDPEIQKMLDSSKLCYAEHLESVDEARIRAGQKYHDYCLVQIGTKMIVANKVTQNIENLFLTVNDFHNLKASDIFKVISGKNKDGSPRLREYKASKLWIESPERDTRTIVAFDPKQKTLNTLDPTYQGTLNLWRGFAYEGNHDNNTAKSFLSVQLFLDHVKNNICDGSELYSNHLNQFIGHMIQKPWQKPSFAIVLKSESKGTGKSFFANAISKIVGQHSISVSDPKHLTGSFNAMLANSILVISEEASFAGSKKDSDKLKNIITEPSITLEKKGIDAKEISSFHRLIMLSNHDWVVPASKDERRYFVLEVANHKKQDTSYFKAISDAFDAEGYQGLFDYYRTLDLTGFNKNDTLKTKALQEQILESLDNCEKFIFDMLNDAGFNDVHLNDQSATRIPKHYFYNAYLEFAREQFGNPVDKRKFGKVFMRTLEPKDIGKSCRVEGSKKQVNGYELDDLSTLRERFSKYFNLDDGIFK